VAGVTCQVAPRFQPVSQLSPSTSATPSLPIGTPGIFSEPASVVYGTAFEKVAFSRWKLMPAPSESWSFTFQAMLGLMLIASTDDSSA